jgi:transcriptional regulator with XRE-family HTH domain
MKNAISFQEHLRGARQAARLSQLELALRLQVSQRHISYVEGGRANPSRELLVLWLQVLKVPMPLRNLFMKSAGYSAVYSEVSLDSPNLLLAQTALAALLQSHDPMPCFVLDSNWDLLQSNQAGRWLSATLIPELATTKQGIGINMLDVLIHPDGYTKKLLNIDEIGPKFLDHLTEEALLNPALVAQVEKFRVLVEKLVPRKTVMNKHAVDLSPILISKFGTDFGTLSFFSMFTTFGRPQDITLASLRVEHLFAADEHTKKTLTEQVR